MKRFLCLGFALLVVWAMPGLALAQLQGYTRETGYQYIQLGHFPQTEDGGVEPILWRVLAVEDGVAYLLSDCILEARQVHHAWESYTGWLDSDMYHYLNTAFIEAAFTPEERGMLVHSVLPGTITLPTAQDIKNPAYGFFKNADRLASGTPWARANGLFTYMRSTHCPYWTRTPDTAHKGAVKRTLSGGAVGYMSAIVADMGPRPACYLDLSTLPPLEGAGTLSLPFWLPTVIPADRGVSP